MQNVPKIVQAQLQRATPKAAESHPDADLLTAFAEQSLSDSEREHVMDHLVRCGDCREVVALALPGTETVTLPISVGTARGSWLSWPVLRWGVVAAGIALVTSVGILQFRHRTQQNAALVADSARQEEKVTTTPGRPSTPTAPASVPQDADIAKETPTRKLSRSQTAVAADQASPSPNAIFPPAQPAGRAGSGGGIGGGVFRAAGNGSGSGQAPKNNPEQLHGEALGLGSAAKEAVSATSQYSTGQPVAAAPPQVAGRSTSQMVEVQSESTQVVTQGQAQGQLAQNQVELPLQKRPLNNLDVVKAKDSVPPEAQSSVVLAPNVPTPNISLQKERGSSLRWSISSGGGLQRSFDEGTTWEDVNVNQTPLASAARMAMASDSKDQVESKTIKKKEQRNPVVVFRAVAALGPEVWAGGSGAMLYHSLDSGNHWTRVVPSEANASLTGDIVSVEFSDTYHGKIATSTGEVWMTGDHGQTWRKQ